jgi:hypothetical protein
MSPASKSEICFQKIPPASPFGMERVPHRNSYLSNEAKPKRELRLEYGLAAEA